MDSEAFRDQAILAAFNGLLKQAVWPVSEDSVAIVYTDVAQRAIRAGNILYREMLRQQQWERKLEPKQVEQTIAGC